MNGLLVSTSVAPLLSEPRLSSSQLSQLVLGEAAEVLETVGTMLRVRTVLDAYEGWLHRGYVALAPMGEVEQWLVNAGWSLGALIARREEMLVRAPHRARLVIEGPEWVRLPDGQSAKRLEGEVLPYGETIVACSAVAPEEWAWSEFAGTSYLWGGITASGMDCSGLVQVTFVLRGIALPRDARDQMAHGRVIAPEDRRPGDLLFFRAEDAERIDHVAFLAANDELVHATVATGCVTRERWDAGSRAAPLRERLVAVRRLT